MHKYPNEITIDNTTYPLISGDGRSYATTFPTLYADGRQIISVEHTYGTPVKEAVERATTAVRSYLASGKRYSIIPDLTFDDQVQTYALETLDLRECSVELYGSEASSHLVVSREREDKPYLCFCIWDKTLQLAVLDAMKQPKQPHRHYNIMLHDYHVRLSAVTGDTE